MSIASLKEEADREHALAALGGTDLPPWLLGMGGTTDLINWSGWSGSRDGFDPSRPADLLVEAHLQVGDLVRVTAKLIPEWVLGQMQDLTQLDGRAVLERLDLGIVYLRLVGLGMPFRPGNPWMESGPVFAVGAQAFLVSVCAGEIVDAT